MLLYGKILPAQLDIHIEVMRRKIYAKSVSDVLQLDEKYIITPLSKPISCHCNSSFVVLYCTWSVWLTSRHYTLIL